MNTINQPRIPTFGVLFLVFCIATSSQARTQVNVLVDARGYGGAATTNQTSQSVSNLPVEASETRAWSGGSSVGWTESSGTVSARAEVGHLRFQAHGVAKAEIIGTSGSLPAQGRAVAYVFWDDRFTVNVSPSLAGQVGELTATIVIDGELIHTAHRTDSGLSFRMSCLLQSGAFYTNFHGGTGLRVGNDGLWQRVPLDGALIGPGVYQVPMRFRFGDQISVSVWCQVDADARELANSPTQGRMEGESIGGRSLAWGGISQLRVVGGNAVTNFTITSGSGYDYLIGTIANPPVITRIQTTSQGLALEWTDLGPRAYTVETTPALAPVGWTPVQDVTWPIQTNKAVLPLPGQSPAFFRVRVQ